jgi:type 1 fimbriae regulatory protein FimB
MGQNRKAMQDERKHLTVREVEKLMAATQGGRNAARDHCLLLLMFRHGLRVSEACGLRLAQIDIESRVIHCARLKRGVSTTQPLRPDELRAIKAWLQRRGTATRPSDAFFLSERGDALNRRSAWHAVKRYGELAGLPVAVHPHMLRHACGYALADQGADAFLIRDYLGHRKAESTSIYVAANPARFGRLWRN